MTATDPETIKLSVEQEDVRYYAGVLDWIFAGLGRSSKDRQLVQLCSTDTNAPVLLIEVNGVILRFPFIPGWGTIDAVCPPAVIERHILEESRRRAGLVIGPGGRESGSLPRDDRPNSREHWVKIKYAGCPPWREQKGFRIIAGKTHVQHSLPVSYEPIVDPAVFNAKCGAAPTLQEDVPASVLVDLGLLAETVCPGVRMKFHTAHVEGERIYFFDLRYDGKVVADGRMDPDLTR
ncbi:hypothetical protein AUQ48_16670 [Kocuria flava]|uniref:Uncharacterized protein n=1 Tax=Kocuria flava TaxID=446860 RepID=A0A2N4SXJ1_9MICC|nr:hypothetical protein [Kocuria flava]PLC10692.1 hypothetical protein AUQ48_16670 [Kocuria flava]